MTREAVTRIPVHSKNVRGIAASIMYSIPPEHRDWLDTLIASGMTTDDALEVIARGISLRIGKVVQETRPKVENPFRPPRGSSSSTR